MAKPKDIQSYDPKWEQLAITMLDTPALIEIPVPFTRREAIDIRQTYYGYRTALRRATLDASISVERKQELTLFYRAVMAFQCHIDPNPNNTNNDSRPFKMKFIKQGATQPISKFFSAIEDRLAPQPEFVPHEEEAPGVSMAQEAIDAYLSTTDPDEEK